jgi:hypothetical protein
MSGFAYEVGVAQARADLASAAPAQPGAHAANAIAALGHSAYLAGYAAARGGGAASAAPGHATGHADYQNGVTAAQANPAGPPPARPAEAVGFQEYGAGATYARAGVANFNGAPPPLAGAARGVTDYQDGVTAARTHNPAPLAPVITVLGYQDYSAGRQDAADRTIDTGRTHAGYLLGVAETPVPAAGNPKKRPGGVLEPSDSKEARS